MTDDVIRGPWSDLPDRAQVLERARADLEAASVVTIPSLSRLAR